MGRWATLLLSLAAVVAEASGQRLETPAQCLDRAATASASAVRQATAEFDAAVQALRADFETTVALATAQQKAAEAACWLHAEQAAEGRLQGAWKAIEARRTKERDADAQQASSGCCASNAGLRKAVQRWILSSGQSSKAGNISAWNTSDITDMQECQ